MGERNLSEQAAQHGIGKLIDGTPGRDAVHIAVAPVTALERVWAGQALGLASGDGVVSVLARPTVGIVDPFLPRPVHPGERFWMFLLPNTITGLRHEWTHPAFGAATADVSHQEESRRWLEDKASELDLPYDALLAAAKRRAHDGEHTIQQGSEYWRDAFGDPREFWHHYEIVTGESVSDMDAAVFSCSC